MHILARVQEAIVQKKKKKVLLKSKDKAGLRKTKLSRIKPEHGFYLIISPPHPTTSLSSKAEGPGWRYSYIPVPLQGTDNKVKNLSWSLCPHPHINYQEQAGNYPAVTMLRATASKGCL